MDWIITNPPYSKNTEFMRKALELAPTKGFCWFWTLLVKGPITDKRIDIFVPYWGAPDWWGGVLFHYNN